MQLKVQRYPLQSLQSDSACIGLIVEFPAHDVTIDCSSVSHAVSADIIIKGATTTTTATAATTTTQRHQAYHIILRIITNLNLQGI